MLIEKRDEEKLKLLYLLWKYNNYEEVPLQNFAYELSIDKRSLRRRLEELLADLETVDNNYGSILVSDASLKISFSNVFDENKLIALYSERSVLFNLALSILMNDFESVETFAKRNFISSVTLYRKLPVLKEELDRLGLRLDLRTTEKILGNERQIRLFYFYLLIGISDYLDIFSNKDEFVENSFHPFFKLWLLITHFRLANNYVISTYDDIDSISTFLISLDQFQASYLPELDSFLSPYQLDNFNKSREIHSMYIFISHISLIYLSQDELSTIHLNRDKRNYTNLLEVRTIIWIENFCDYFHFYLSDYQFAFMFYLILQTQITEYYLVTIDTEWFYGHSYKFSSYNGIGVLNDKLDAFFDHLKKVGWFVTNSTSYSVLGYKEKLFSIIPELLQPVNVTILSRYDYSHRYFIKNMLLSISTVKIVFSDAITADTQFVIHDYPLQFNHSIKSIRIRIHPFPSEIDYIKRALEDEYYNQL
ncbi:helix-turn-helix domain-containing protein [Candidatus Enterococcus clewellii]|uniref:Mga helix-turn-helix domain-containing protein n=1 Tax=Candidatus Enterococcus clewellii TaxID=1834193 RepID=A0AAQ3XZE4_9ENTE